MKIAVVGTGANGAGIGADLTRAGYDTTFIEQWPDHVAAMRAGPLRVELPDGVQETEVHALHLCDVATLRDPFDLVFVLVKAYDTRWACELIKPLVKPDGIVVGLQNGMTLDDMSDVIGVERTLGAVIEVSAAMWEPGVVRRNTPHARSWFALGGLVPDTVARAVDVAAVLGAAGTVEVVPDIRSAKWTKLLVNAGELVPTAILDEPLLAAAALPGMREYMLQTSLEAADAAVSAGSRLVPILGVTDVDPADHEAYVARLLDVVLAEYALPDTRTTVLQDWMKGRRSEVDQINGVVADEHHRLGLRAPANEATVEVAHRIERGELARGRGNLRLLVEATVRVP